MENIIIFGDSHTRSFSNIPNVYPFFLGSGKHFNLFDDCIKNITDAIHRFFKVYTYDFSRTVFCLYFGEPNCRFLINNDWRIFSNIPMTKWNKIVIQNKFDEIQKLIGNYSLIINTIHIYTKNILLFTPTTAFYPSYVHMTHFNQCLKNKYQDMVIDLYANISEIDMYKTQKIDKIICRKELLNENISYDPIHLNHNISKLLTRLLVEQNRFNINIAHDKPNDFIFQKHASFDTFVIRSSFES